MQLNPNGTRLSNVFNAQANISDGRAGGLKVWRKMPMCQSVERFYGDSDMPTTFSPSTIPFGKLPSDLERVTNHRRVNSQKKQKALGEDNIKIH